jgi:hypothetical protein
VAASSSDPGQRQVGARRSYLELILPDCFQSETGPKVESIPVSLSFALKLEVLGDRVCTSGVIFNFTTPFGGSAL